MESLDNSQGYHSDFIQGFDNGMNSGYSTDQDALVDGSHFGMGGSYDRNSHELTRMLQSPRNDSGFHSSLAAEYYPAPAQEYPNSEFVVPFTPNDPFLSQNNHFTMPSFPSDYNENWNLQPIQPNNHSTEIPGPPTQFTPQEPREPSAQGATPGDNNVGTYPANFSSPPPAPAFNARDFSSVDPSALVDQCRSLQSEINVPNNLSTAPENEVLKIFMPYSRSDSSRLRENLFGVRHDAQMVMKGLRLASQNSQNSQNRLRLEAVRGLLNLFSNIEFPHFNTQNQCSTPSQFDSSTPPVPAMETKKIISEKDIPSLVNELKEIVRKNKAAFRNPPERESRFNPNLGQMNSQTLPSSFPSSNQSPSTNKLPFSLDESHNSILHSFKTPLTSSPSVSSPRSSAAKDILTKHKPEDWDVGNIQKKQKIKTETAPSPINGLSQNQPFNNGSGTSRVNRNAEELIGNQQIQIQNLRMENEQLKKNLEQLKQMVESIQQSHMSRFASHE